LRPEGDIRGASSKSTYLRQSKCSANPSPLVTHDGSSKPLRTSPNTTLVASVDTIASLSPPKLDGIYLKRDTNSGLQIAGMKLAIDSIKCLGPVFTETIFYELSVQGSG
jgi:hypothetical protein